MQVSPALHGVLRRLVARDPLKRHRRADEALADLERASNPATHEQRHREQAERQRERGRVSVHVGQVSARRGRPGLWIVPLVILGPLVFGALIYQSSQERARPRLTEDQRAQQMFSFLEAEAKKREQQKLLAEAKAAKNSQERRRHGNPIAFSFIRPKGLATGNCAALALEYYSFPIRLRRADAAHHNLEERNGGDAGLRRDGAVGDAHLAEWRAQILPGRRDDDHLDLGRQREQRHQPDGAGACVRARREVGLGAAWGDDGDALLPSRPPWERGGDDHGGRGVGAQYRYDTYGVLVQVVPAADAGAAASELGYTGGLRLSERLRDGGTLEVAADPIGFS